MGALMVEKKGAKPDTTTVRLYDLDGEELSDFAGLSGVTIADAYREHCAPVIRRLLKEEMEKRLKNMKD
jgi:hypothetical protein